MPTSFINQQSEGWACAQRRPLRSLAHVLRFFDAGFVLIADDDTFINARMLLPGGKLHDFIHTTMAETNIVAGELFYFGGAGYLLGRLTLSLLESHTLLGPRADGDRMGLDVLKEAYLLSERYCLPKGCVHLMNGEKKYRTIGSSAMIDIRVVDMCRNLMSEERTCYHSDHAMSRCLAHAAYASFLHVRCDEVAIGGVYNVSFGMCQDPWPGCDVRVHLTCHRFEPGRGGNETYVPALVQY